MHAGLRLVTWAGLALGAVTALASCAMRQHSEPAVEGRLISRAEIEKLGAITAWEVLRRTTNLHLEESRSGRPTQVLHRGRGSIDLRDTPMLVIDGARIEDLSMLAEMPADVLYSILILSGTQGTIRYGTNAHSGVIVITTVNSNP